MSDATLVAGELADIVAGFDRLTLAIAQLRPTVNVAASEVPAVTVAAPVINVAPAEVNVAPAIVNVPLPRPVAYRVRVTSRDLDGLIAEFVLEPI